MMARSCSTASRRCRRGGLVNVVVGQFKVQDASDQTGRLGAIEQGIANGAVAGSRVKVTRTNDPVGGPASSPGLQEDADEASVRRGLAEVLEQAPRTRADPDAGDYLNQRPLVVPLPKRPVLSRSVLRGRTRSRPRLP